MDYPLGDSLYSTKSWLRQVLIPILMDYPLGVRKRSHSRPPRTGLNPYSNGLPSRGVTESRVLVNGLPVLIPILMDYPLGGLEKVRLKFQSRVLIPILMDYPLGVRSQMA